MTVLAISPCPNDTFVFHALVHGLVPLPARAPGSAGGLGVRYADIDVCNGLAAEGAADVVKVSVAALPELLGNFRLLTAGAALGHGCGPLLLTTPGKVGWRPGATVAVPGLRTTAYLLFRLWLAATERPAPTHVVVLPFEQIMPAVRDGQVDAGLVIHEARFTYQGFGLVQILDLGAWWESDTGLPVPLGAIVARRELDSDAWSAAVRASVEAAWRDPAASRAFVLAHAQETAPEVVDQHIATYVNDFTRDIGDDGRAAIDLLLRRAASVA